MVFFQKIKDSILKLRKCFYYFRYEYVLIPLAYRYTSKFDIMDSMESIQYIIDHKCSVSRFGDGEFDCLLAFVDSSGKLKKKDKLPFNPNLYENPSPELSAKLFEVLNSSVNNHIVGISRNLKTVEGLIDGGKFWRYYTASHFIKLYPLLDLHRKYLDASFTRFYFEKQNKKLSAKQIALIKQIWEDTDVILVEGFLSRSGIGNDLYDNARSVRRILGPSLSAFRKYDDLMLAIKTYAKKDSLIILSLGITATVMAYELAKMGYWAIDLGHVDIEYEWFLRGVEDREAIRGKFTNECSDGHSPEQCNDPVYLSQIVCDCSN